MLPRESFREAHLFSDIALESCGFEIATERKISREIYRVVPSGRRSALFAAIIESLNNIRSLNLMIEDSGTAHNWRLAIVVVVSSHDSASQMDWNEVKRVYLETKQRLKVSRFDIVFVAYNVDRQVYQQLFFLQNLDDFGYTQLHLASSRQLEDGYENIGRLMQRIRDSLGMVRNEKKVQKQPEHLASDHKINPSLSESLQRNPYEGYNRNFGIMFTISADERYRGEAWSSLCHGVQTFTKYFGGEDLVGCTVFTEWCQLYSKDRFQRRVPAFIAPSPPPPPPHPPINRPIGRNQINAPLLPPPQHHPRVAPGQIHIVPINPPRNNNCCRIFSCCLGIISIFIVLGLIVGIN